VQFFKFLASAEHQDIHAGAELQAKTQKSNSRASSGARPMVAAYHLV